MGAQVRVRAALLHQVLRHLQVALLARQVQGRGTVLDLGIRSPANGKYPQRLSAPALSKAFLGPSPPSGEFWTAGTVGRRGLSP